MKRLACIVWTACGSGVATTAPVPTALPTRPQAVPKLRVVDASGSPVAGALLTVTTGEQGVRLQAGEDGTFAVESTGEVAISATSPTGDGWAFEPHFIPHAPADIRLRTTDCEVFAGTLRGSALPARFNVARVSDNNGDSFGIAVGPDGGFHACLPPGDYGGDPVHEYQAAQMFLRLPATIELPIEPRATYEQDATSVAGLSGETATQFLSNLPSDVDVIAIAETNHGTREFVTERAMLTLELARTRGGHLAMMEAGFAEVVPLDDYINGSKLDVAKAVTGLDYWIWDTRTFIDVLEQMRALNHKRSAKDRLHLVGFDMQDTHAGIPQLIAAHAVDAAVVPALQRLIEKNGSAWKKMSEAERAPVIAALQVVADRRDDNGVASRTNRLALAAHQLVLRLHALESTDSMVRFQGRDRDMAALALDILARSTTPHAVLWAHLGHLGRNYVLGEPPMGSWLAQALGKRYEVFALLAASGSSRGWDAEGKIGVISRELPKPPPHSLEAMLGAHRVGPVTYFRFAAALPPARDWLAGLHPLRQFGAAHPTPDQEFPPYAEHSIDGAILIDAVHPTEPMATGERRKN